MHQGKHAHPVDGIPFAKIDQAFSQIERTIEKNASADPGTGSGEGGRG